MNKLVRLCVFCALLCMLFIGSAFSASFMKIDGIPGESTDDAHKDEIDILSWSWGAQRKVSLRNGRGAPPKISKSIADMDVSFTKYLDKATVPLFMACANGTRIEEVVLTVRKAGDTPLEYYIVTMKDVMVTSISTGGSGGEDVLTENVTLNFSKFDVNYTPIRDDGSLDPPIEYGWKLRNKKERD